MDINQLNALKIEEIWLNPINKVFDKYEINTPLRQAAFIGQCQHESVNFKRLEEDLNYSSERLCQVFPNRFKSIAEASPYNYNPIKIGNKIYSDRLGNGDEASGDGYRFRGRGIIQITGRNLYSVASSDLGADFVKNPELVATPLYAALTAGWYWNRNSLNLLADHKEYTTMTKRINGGLNGIDSRISKIEEAFRILS